MRRKLVLWMAEVGEEFKLSEATYHLSVTLVDEMLSKNPFPIRREQFQAVGWYVVAVVVYIGVCVVVFWIRYNGTLTRFA